MWKLYAIANNKLRALARAISSMNVGKKQKTDELFFQYIV